LRPYFGKFLMQAAELSQSASKRIMDGAKSKHYPLPVEDGEAMGSAPMVRTIGKPLKRMRGGAP
jgi:hypothetical protein